MIFYGKKYSDIFDISHICNIFLIQRLATGLRNEKIEWWLGVNTADCYKSKVFADLNQT